VRGVFQEQLGRLEKAIARDGGYTLGDVLVEIQAQRAKLWEAPGAVIVTQVHDFPRQRVLHFWLAAGELDALFELEKTVLEWGKGVGCTRATIAGRRGWARVLASRGWEAEQTLMGRTLTDGEE